MKVGFLNVKIAKLRDKAPPPPAKTKCVLDGDHGYKGAFVDSFTQGAVPWCN